MNQAQEYWGMSAKSYCMLIHLSQLSSIVAPGLGFVMPLVMWVANKDKNADIDQHGKVTLNWVISLIIYSIICGVLTLIFIGVIGFIVLALLNFVFAIVAAVKANNGELWRYPLSIPFLK
jgi:uncharacterized protein